MKEMFKKILTHNSVFVALVATIIFLVCLGACAPKHSSYSDFKDIPQTGWCKSAPYYYEMQYADSALTYDISLSIRHDNYYSYRNLWLFVDYISSDSTINRDTINCELADEFGNWYSSGFGTLYQYEQKLRSGVRPADVSRIVVWQGMRKDTINHLSNVGITVSPTL